MPGKRGILAIDKGLKGVTDRVAGNILLFDRLKFHNHKHRFSKVSNYHFCVTT